MSTRTLVEISPEPRTWDSQYGQMAAFRLTFEDGMKAELVTKAETVEKRRGELKAALGHPGEWVLEDQGAFPDGKPKPQKVKDYPGKPQAKAGGGGGGLSFEDRLKLDEATSEHMDIRTALMQAVAFHTAGGVSREMGVLDTATKYLGWLRAQRSPEPRSGATQSSAGAGVTTRRVAPASPTSGEEPASPVSSGEGLSAVGSSSGTIPVQGRGHQAAAGESAYRASTLDSRREGQIPSAPAAATNHAGEPSPPQGRTPASPGDGLEVQAGPPPSPGTNRAGAPTPPQVRTPAPPGDGSTNYSESSPSPGTCPHPSWSPAPNELAAKRGVEVCDVCGHAEKRKASV